MIPVNPPSVPPTQPAGDTLGMTGETKHADHIKRLLRARGETQSWLAEQLGVSTNAVSKWFRTGQISLKNYTRAVELLEGGGYMVRDGSPTSYESAPRGVSLLPKLSTEAAMGNGIALQEHDEVIDSIRVNMTLLRQRVSFSSPANLRVLTGLGDSMAPTFKDGDLLLVDTGVTHVKIDAVYVMQRHDELFIKRLQRRPDGRFTMKSDNELFDDYVIDDPVREGFDVRGRVLVALNMQVI